MRLTRGRASFPAVSQSLAAAWAAWPRPGASAARLRPSPCRHSGCIHWTKVPGGRLSQALSPKLDESESATGSLRAGGPEERAQLLHKRSSSFKFRLRVRHSLVARVPGRRLGLPGPVGSGKGRAWGNGHFILCDLLDAVEGAGGGSCWYKSYSRAAFLCIELDYTARARPTAVNNIADSAQNRLPLHSKGSRG